MGHRPDGGSYRGPPDGDYGGPQAERGGPGASQGPPSLPGGGLDIQAAMRAAAAAILRSFSNEDGKLPCPR